MKKLITKVAIGGLVAAGTISGVVALGSTSATAATNFQMPFPCGQQWVSNVYSGHSPDQAIDFNRSGDEGDTVVAAASGTVVTSTYIGDYSYGSWIKISHGNGYETRYAHLSARYVKAGQKVVQGQKIGAVGNTGGSYGAHLHYEQRINGNDVRPRFNGSTVAYGKHTYTSRNCGGGSTTPGNPQSISDACGSGYKVIDSKAITGAKVYLTYSSSTGKNCVATLKTSKIGTKSPVSAFLQVSGGTRTTDSGTYGYYAGPVKKAAAHKCVKWGGSAGTASYTSPFEHCG